MASIVDLYKQHKDLLSVYFKSEEEAAECEKRAEMGDDRAMRVMSLAYDSKISTTRSVDYSVQVGSWAGSTYHDDIPIWHSLDTKERNKFNSLAKTELNFDAMPFEQSVKNGARTLLIRDAQWQPTIRYSDKTLLSEFKQSHGRRNSSPHYLNLEYKIMPPHSLRFELSQGENKSAYNTLYVANVEWPTDKRSTGNHEHGNGHGGWTYSTKHIEPLETCAKAGSIEAARLLERIYSQTYFYEVERYRFFRDPDYEYNNLYDSAKAKYWQRAAEHLEGKSASPIEREKFLNEFLFSQDGTPEGLYNIGYALYHNEKIGDKERGLDYLKHAANLGYSAAARELGEIFHDMADTKGDSRDLSRAHFWYKVAAELGHVNGKARAEYLEKAHPELTQWQMDEKATRNPSDAHVSRYPASSWYVDVPKVDVGDMIHNPTHGNLIHRMEKAVEAIDSSVKEFETVTRTIQARTDDLVTRQILLDAGVEADKVAETDALKFNQTLSDQQRISQRAINLSQDRWTRETMSNMGATLIFAWAGGAIPALDDMKLGRLIPSNAARASGYNAVSKNEVAYQQAIIDELEARKIDTSKFPEQIKELAKIVQEVADSIPMQKLMKDENRSRAIVEGYLRQRILKSGLENARALNDYAVSNGLESVDAFLAQFEKGDADLYQALTNLCHGHANSRDMSVILTDTNALKGNELASHEKALKKFIERVVKNNIGHYMTRASQIDVIDDLKLVNFKTMDVDTSKGTADLVQGLKEPSADEMGERQVDMATKLALTSMFSSQFGVTHIGQYDVTRMFDFYLHRHGKKELIASELYDGVVADIDPEKDTLKKVSVLEPDKISGFVERAKTSAKRHQETLPNVGDLFLRVCGYEYYLPQAVITSGRGNRFKENPEAPVAYPMVNEVVNTFIDKLSLTDIGEYRQKVGKELDNIIAQSFIDFFHDMGKQHTEKFAEERKHLRDGHANAYYDVRFDTYQDKISADIIAQFPQFLEIYERNLSKSLTVLPEAEAVLVKQQIASLQEDTQQYLAPESLKIDSFQAKLDARNKDHRGSNMTEQWGFV